MLLSRKKKEEKKEQMRCAGAEADITTNIYKHIYLYITKVRERERGKQEKGAPAFFPPLAGCVSSGSW